MGRISGVVLRHFYTKSLGNSAKQDGTNGLIQVLKRYFYFWNLLPPAYKNVLLCQWRAYTEYLKPLLHDDILYDIILYLHINLIVKILTMYDHTQRCI